MTRKALQNRRRTIGYPAPKLQNAKQIFGNLGKTEGNAKKSSTKQKANHRKSSAKMAKCKANLRKTEGNAKKSTTKQKANHRKPNATIAKCKANLRQPQENRRKCKEKLYKTEGEPSEIQRQNCKM